MAIDISGLNYFMPLIGWLFIFVIMFSLLQKTKLLSGNKVSDSIVSAIIALIFALMADVRSYVETVTPWFAVLMLALFFIILIIGMSQSKVEAIMKPGFVWVFIIILILIFLISATNVFSSTMGNAWDSLSDFFTNQAKIAGGVALLIIAVLVSLWFIKMK